MSELALQLIKENKRTKSRFLDLGNCGLTELPAEVSELFWLKTLSLASQWSEWDGRVWHQVRSRNIGDPNKALTDLRPLAGLSALQELYISRTLVSDLAPLAGLSALQTLFVEGTQVSDLAPLARLLSLQTLLVSNTRISDLSPLAGMPALQELDVSETEVSDLTPLAALPGLHALNVSDTRITNLAPLSGLSGLRALYVWRTQVSDLMPLAGLSALETLYVWGTQVDELTPLAALSDLRTLYINRTMVTDLQPLAGLSDLQTLILSETNVSDLMPIAALRALQRVDLSSTRVTNLSPLFGLIRRGLPVKWTSHESDSDGIYIHDCPLINLPPEILKQGLEAIQNYFRELALGEVDHLYEAKMLILGEGSAGKTSLLRRLYQPGQPLPKEDETTRGIAIYRHEFRLKNGQLFRLNVWDFGGQQIYHATHQFFLTYRSLYLLVDDTRKDHKSVSDEGFRYWLELIDVFSGHSPTLIFQNEKGGRSKAIDIGGIKSRYDNVKELYAGNLEHGNAADKVREGIEFYASHLSHIGEELPRRWIKVRADIEELSKKEPYVPVETYFEVYGSHIEWDEAKALLLSRYLHDLARRIPAFPR